MPCAVAGHHFFKVGIEARPSEIACPHKVLTLVFAVVFGYTSDMSSPFISYVEPVLRVDLDDLTVGQLQVHALELQRASGRLAGRATQVLAAVHAAPVGRSWRARCRR